MSRPTIKSAQTLEYLQLFRINSSRSVMIRDLPFSCVNEDVSILCQDILGIRPPLVHVIFDAKGCPLHYGYVLFESDDDAHQAIAKMDQLRFRGRDIRFVPFNSTGSHEKGRQGAVHVYFRAQGSLPSPITEETLRRFLETYGELEHVIIRTYSHNPEGLVEGFGFATFLDPNVHHRVCSEAKRLVFEGVAYDCTFSRKLSPRAPTAPQSWTNVPSSSHISPPQYAQVSSHPASFTAKAASSESYDSSASQPSSSYAQPSPRGQTESYGRPNIAPITTGAYINVGYAPRPYPVLDGYQSPRGHTVLVVPSPAGVHPSIPGASFNHVHSSMPTMGGYPSNLPLAHGLPPSPMHALQYSPGLFPVQSFSYQVSPSMTAPPSPPGAPLQYIPMSYPLHSASPFPGPSTVQYGSTSSPFGPRKDAPNA